MYIIRCNRSRSSIFANRSHFSKPSVVVLLRKSIHSILVFFFLFRWFLFTRAVHKHYTYNHRSGPRIICDYFWLVIYSSFIWLSAVIVQLRALISNAVNLRKEGAKRPLCKQVKIIIFIIFLLWPHAVWMLLHKWCTCNYLVENWQTWCPAHKKNLESPTTNYGNTYAMLYVNIAQLV